MTRNKTRNVYILASSHLPLNAISNQAWDRSGHRLEETFHAPRLPCKTGGMFATSGPSILHASARCMCYTQPKKQDYLCSSTYAAYSQYLMSEYLHLETKYQHRQTSPYCPGQHPPNGAGRELPDQTQSRCLLHLLSHTTFYCVLHPLAIFRSFWKSTGAQKIDLNMCLKQSKHTTLWDVRAFLEKWVCLSLLKGFVFITFFKSISDFYSNLWSKI